ncbi:MAG: 16S rRNA C967 or C1407 C5-methylase, RsmB/RsmF family [Verrucomicrobia bacterium]|nr:MAG: 16S rRNA C967 or C1407 C5-methylase, RsmB/RsmF family [Verrucomicrobiota bacterium]
MPSRLLATLARRLFPDEAEGAAFLNGLQNPAPEQRAVIWTGHPDSAWIQAHAVPPPPETSGWPWPDWLSPVPPGFRPGQDPLHEAGAFYSLDLSSVWAASPLLSLKPPPQPRVLDVCAAPGGKSIFASRALAPGLLLSNEIIGKRLGILRHNLSRCGIRQAFTQRLDPADLAAKLPESFDVVLVDAPCSGQSLLTKGIENPGCFHPTVVQHNARRQRRILAEAARTVGPGGHLLYTTCTFAPEENEKVIAWFLQRSPGFRPVEVPHLEFWRTRLHEIPAYRLFPQQGIGAGGFACLLQRNDFGRATAEIPPPLLDYPVP